jgi:transcriptional regulator with XRE-family HTH domain
LAGNNKLAARSWKELAKKFYDRKDLKFCIYALNESLELYSEVDDLDYKKEILEQIHREMKFCDDEIFYSSFPKDIKQYSSEIKYYREKLRLSFSRVSRTLRPTLDPAMIECWEKGEEMEQLENYLKLSNVFDCRVDQLINYDYPINNEYSINNKPIKSKIQELREKKGYKEQELADKINVGIDLIKQWQKSNELKSLKQFLDLYYFYLRDFKNHQKNLARNTMESPPEIRELAAETRELAHQTNSLLEHKLENQSVKLFIESLPGNNHYLKI